MCCVMCTYNARFSHVFVLLVMISCITMNHVILLQFFFSTVIFFHLFFQRTRSFSVLSILNALFFFPSLPHIGLNRGDLITCCTFSFHSAAVLFFFLFVTAKCCLFICLFLYTLRTNICTFSECNCRRHVYQQHFEYLLF